MTRIDNSQPRLQAAGVPVQRPVAAAAGAPSFAEMLRAVQGETADAAQDPAMLASQVARLVAGGKLDPQAAVMLSLAGGFSDTDVASLLTLPTTMGQPIPAAYVNASAPQPASGAAMESFTALKPHFLQAEKETGVPWQIQAAQWALETGWGKATPKDSQTGRESYNLFGVKGTGPAGSVESATTEFMGGRMVRTVDRFRAYNSYAESIVEHARLLTSDYYKPAHAAGKDLKAWTEMLGPQGLGYATDPEYSRKLWQIIRDNGWEK